MIQLDRQDLLELRNLLNVAEHCLSVAVNGGVATLNGKPLTAKELTANALQAEQEAGHFLNAIIDEVGGAEWLN